jgi:hypothetical protein
VINKNAIAAFIVNIWIVRWAIDHHRKECRRNLLLAFGEDPDSDI